MGFVGETRCHDVSQPGQRGWAISSMVLMQIAGLGRLQLLASVRLFCLRKASGLAVDELKQVSVNARASLSTPCGQAVVTDAMEAAGQDVRRKRRMNSRRRGNWHDNRPPRWR